jgi:Uma2 family endonuclease
MVFAIVSPEKIQLPPGTVMRIPGDWQLYRHLSDQLGDRSIPRLKYRPGEILLMTPSPEHGSAAHIAAMVAVELLQQSNQTYKAYTPITLERPEESGIEPDYCFYIDHWEAVRGKTRIDWQVDPPPDLVIEIDVTSYTDIEDYIPYRVPEVWLLKRGSLRIYQFVDGQYILCSESRFFPGQPISMLVTDCSRLAIEESTSAAIRYLRRKLAETD